MSVLARLTSRRAWLAAAALACLPLGAAAQFRVEISGVGATQVPVAMAQFKGESLAPQAISAIIKADLERSGQFRILDMPGDRMDDSTRPPLADWKAKADAMVLGSVTQLADGRYDVRFRLWDTLKAADQGGQSLVVTSGDLRLAAHRAADFIYEKLTGDKGAFATRIAYVSKVGKRYTLNVADADGEGVQPSLTSPASIISPAWSPDGRYLAYVSFEGGKAIVVVQEVLTGKRRVLAAFKGTNSAPTWSPDGTQLVVTLSRDGGSQLYVIGVGGGVVRRLTNSSAIDTEAFWSPDGAFIYFVSDRGGGPQIYKVSPAGGDPQRVTFNGAYNVSPAISPDGRWLTYIGRLPNGDDRVQLMDLSTGNVRVLTDTSDDQRPSFAPNSKLIVYATRVKGREVLMTTSLDGRIKARLATPNDVREPVWGPQASASRR
ncbi:MAG: Tol-Pal system protein TolB [Burkholderiales bacterium]|nr:Tol-Pal system protein TolB [Burkholderiales bacterium]